MHIAEMAVPDTRTERVPVYSRSRLSKIKPAARLKSRKCLKAIKLRLTLFLQPNHGFGESFCGSSTGSADLLSDPSKSRAFSSRHQIKIRTGIKGLLVPPNSHTGKGGRRDNIRMSEAWALVRPQFFFSNRALEPAGRFAKSLDHGLGAIHLRQPGLDVAQPRHVGFAGLLAQGQFGILQFPK